MLGDQLRKFRRLSKLTQRQAGKLIGATIGTISSWERNERCPHTTTLQRVAEIYGVPLNALFDEENQEEIPVEQNDMVNHPSHYTSGKVECIDALEAATAELSGIEAVCTANAIKYLWRWKLKNGTEDLKKARWYIDRLIREVQE